MDVLVAYGLPALPLSMLTLPVYVYLPAFYAEDLGIGLAAVGVVLLASRLFDVVSDPLVGALSDRLGGRFGRRRPLVLLGAPVVMLGVYHLFMPAGQPDAAYLLMWTLVASLGWTLMTLPLYAWGAELSAHYHERTRIASVRQVFLVSGTLVAGGLAALSMLGEGAARAEALALIGWTVMATLPLAAVLAFLFVPDPAVGRQPAPSWRRGLRTLLDSRPLRRILAANLLNGAANALPATLFLPFVTRILEMPDAAGPLLFAYFGISVLAVPLWLKLSYKLGKHRTWTLALVVAALAFPALLLLGPGDVWGYLPIVLVTGFCVGADLSLPASMQADVVDADAVDGGRQRAGFLFALNGMTGKLALAVAVGVAFPVLELLGMREGEPLGTAAAVGLLTLYCIVPVVLKLAAAALVWRFPIDEAHQERLRAAIRRRAGVAVV